MENLNNTIFVKRKTPKQNLWDYFKGEPIKKSKSRTIKKSFSPRINKELVSYTKKKAKKFRVTKKNLLKLNIGSRRKPKFVKYDSKKAEKFLLNNLKSIKQIDCSEVIPPKQVQSNCWFNTFFVTFFISDKGRKFFKFFRQLMIKGETINKIQIPRKLKEAFFILNIAIEAAQNHILSDLAYNFNTNLLIKKIHNIINHNKNFGHHVPDVNESGNPLDYYLTIINYLNANSSLLIVPINIKKSAKGKNIELLLEKMNIVNKPDIIILELSDEESRNVNDKEIDLKVFDSIYKLDAAVVRDISQEHFCSLLTCNSNGYAFDGASHQRLREMDWKNQININKEWGFPGHDLRWNFKLSYQMLFYYRQK